MWRASSGKSNRQSKGSRHWLAETEAVRGCVECRFGRVGPSTGTSQRLNAARVLVKSVAVCGQTGERSGVQCACIESHVSQHAVERVLCPIPDPERRIVVQIQWLAVGIEEAMTPERPHHTRLARAARSDGVIGLSQPSRPTCVARRIERRSDLIDNFSGKKSCQHLCLWKVVDRAGEGIAINDN